LAVLQVFGVKRLATGIQRERDDQIIPNRKNGNGKKFAKRFSPSQMLAVKC
jgi:hypothetical protein